MCKMNIWSCKFLEEILEEISKNRGMKYGQIRHCLKRFYKRAKFTKEKLKMVVDILCNIWYYLTVIRRSREERNGGDGNMKRYEWRLVNNELGCWEYYDIVRREVLIQTTAIGKEVYEKLGFVEG